MIGRVSSDMIFCPRGIGGVAKVPRSRYTTPVA